ncbi:MarR family transcriptional regulator [Streptomyces sp. NBC_00669]|uniref:MarR family winged helix-turn-helix transcriptional regulator n=1 Tax=unclassified Streptomyces TaxID=2593676 RepID=UPI002E332FDE|nr:MarR family transcriptional regulator [Streptomyces sp. NBC_00669]
MDRQDSIDRMLGQWSWRTHDLPLEQMAVSKRITRMARVLEDLATACLAPLGMDRGEFDVLATLLRSGPAGETTPTELSHWLLISGPGLTKRLGRLEDRGLITRRLAPNDRRSLLVALTDEGRELAERGVQAHAKATAELFDGISATKRERLGALLRELILVAEEP